MTFKKFIFNNYCYWPSNPKKIIEFIGGSYLASNPDITYKRFIESLLLKNYAVHAYKYIPQFDHQELSIKAWKDFKTCKQLLSKRLNQDLPTLRIGHSLGCKLHLIAPDGGRNCERFISISFNNFSANNSIPFLKKISRNLDFNSEFSPSPKRTFNIIQKTYIQNNNLLIKFDSDKLDQTESLISCLKKRTNDKSNRIMLKGNHTLIASAGLRANYLGKWADDNFKRNTILKISQIIDQLN
tara:strand:- start:786 stop:1508 length:723 start_codon:yes stop_codon:yes gene_type:complete